MDSEIIKIKRSKSNREIQYDLTYMLNLKKNYTNKFIYKTETDWKTNTWLPEGKVRGDRFGVWGWHVYIAVFKIDN